MAYWSGAGCLGALHENYVDHYPNAENYNEKNLLRNSSGRAVYAWLNPDIHIQSSATKSSRYADLASAQLPEFHRRYATTAAYLDVNSAVYPWFHTDRLRKRPAVSSQAANVQLWNYLRTVHNGPVLGEGKQHFFWKGICPCAWLLGYNAALRSVARLLRGRSRSAQTFDIMTRDLEGVANFFRCRRYDR
jgi:hypothetical protein